MRSRDELAWEIICHLYADEEENAVMIANSIGECKSTVNSVLQERRNLFSQRSVNYSAKPLWSLTQDSIDAYEKIHAGSAHREEGINTPLFCEECGSLDPNHTPVCSQFDLRAFIINIPSKVNFDSEIGLPKFVGIEYSEKDSEVAIVNRRDTILEFMISEFVPVDSNKLYVKTYGDPRSDERRDALINHFKGINVPAPLPIQELRNNDIIWLNSLNLDIDLP